VQVFDDDTEETLAARILKEEHKIYPRAIQFFAEGKIEINGRKVRIN
jgi:phosphoribosylglycinamide formyltransferase-1